MTFFNRLKSAITRFRDGADGIMTVEMVITLPFLFWMITTGFELFEIHKFKSARIKATHTVADMLSREQLPVNDIYIDNAKALFDAVARDRWGSQVRMTVLRYNSVDEEYMVRWSETRGNGPMSPLTDADVAHAHSELPIMQGGQEMILVESDSDYQPIFGYPGLNNSYHVETKVFVGIRFAPQLCWEGSSCG